MKLSEYLRGPVPKSDPVIRWLNLAAITGIICFLAFDSVMCAINLWYELQ